MDEPAVPRNTRAATQQHAGGDAHAWLPCRSCGADDGEQCYSMHFQAARRRVNVHKINPCASRQWVPR